MTNPVAPPAAPTVPVYPALGSPSFNQEAYAYGSAMPGVSATLGAIGAAAHTNAVSAQESAAAALQAKDQAVDATDGDAQGIALVRGPVILADAALHFDASVDDEAAQTDKHAQLAAFGLVVRHAV